MSSASESSSSESSVSVDGFTTSALASLPVAVRAVLAVLSLLCGLLLCFLSIYGSRWLAHVGKQRGESKSRPLIQGGVTGIVAGALGTGYFTVLIMLLAFARMDGDPTLSAWPFLILVFATALVGATLGGRWRWVSKLFISFVGGLSLTSLLVVSARVQAQAARLILLAIVLGISFLVCSIFAIPRLHFQRASTRAGILLCAVAGAWLFVLSVDIFVQTGLTDSLGLFVSANGVLAQKTDSEGGDNVVHWETSACKGLLAGAWLLALIGTAFQWWRYQVIGDDPDEEWNSYLGTIINSDEKAAGNHVLDNGRTGLFSPRQSFLKRLFSGSPLGGKRISGPATYGNLLDVEQEQASPYPEQMHGDFVYGDEKARSPMMDVDLPSYPRRVSDRPIGLGFGPVRESIDGGGSKPPARYDTTYADTGLYDDQDGDYDIRKTSAGPQYVPKHYLQRNDSEPSFRSVPKYSPPHANNDEAFGSRAPSLSGSTVINGTLSIDTNTRGKAEGSLRSVQSGKGHGMETSDASVEEGLLKTRFGIGEIRRASDPPVRPVSPTSPISAGGRSMSLSSAAQKPASRPGLSHTQSSRSTPASSGKSPRSSSTSPSLPQLETGENPFEQIAVQATPSLLNAIKRVSAAQQQATNDWRARHQDGSGQTSPLGRDEAVLKAAAARRRQSSQEWWSEVERKAAGSPRSPALP